MTSIGKTFSAVLAIAVVVSASPAFAAGAIRTTPAQSAAKATEAGYYGGYNYGHNYYYYPKRNSYYYYQYYGNNY